MSFSSGKRCAVTFDLESDHGWRTQEVYALIDTRWEEFIRVCEELALPLTVFVTGLCLKSRPEAVRALQARVRCEFALHSYSHGTGALSFEKELLQGREIFKEVLGYYPAGYRAPYGSITSGELDRLAATGFEYHSAIGSFFRAFVPGCGRTSSPGVYRYRSGLLEIPVTDAFPGGVPLGYSLSCAFGRWVWPWYVRADPLVTYFHLHDLFRSAEVGSLPWWWRAYYYRKEHGRGDPLARFRDFIVFLRNHGYAFVTLQQLREGECPKK